MQVSNTNTLLTAYRQYTGKAILTADDLFAFVTTPTPERDEFLATYCTCTYSSTDNIVITNYTPL